ncbi:hypothetical protein KBD34_01515 [Patescibacteria group bacterium]|nr:hypothetical protein [Patescibacteria group bacterium]
MSGKKDDPPRVPAIERAFEEIGDDAASKVTSADIEAMIARLREKWPGGNKKKRDKSKDPN